jgi:hypothetical protein
MDRPIKISVCGSTPLIVDAVYDIIHKIPFFEVMKSDDFRNSDIIYWIYCKGPSIIKYYPVWIKKDPIIINHWIGTDVMGEIERNRQHGIHRIQNSIQDFIYYWKWKNGGLINLAAAPWLIDELSKLHINATFLPITTIDLDQLEPADIHLKKDIDFLTYVPFRSFDFYGGDKIVKLAQRWQKYQFLLVIPDLGEIPLDFIEKMPKNIILSPKVTRSEMFEFYKRSKFFIRYTQHDAISLSVLEALYFNLHVLWTYDFPFTEKIETEEKFSDSIPDLVQNWQPNEDGHTFIIENYSTERFREDFVKIIQNKTKLLK